MTIGVLAVQGAFAEHESMLESLGESYIELRNRADTEKCYDGIILPGGESTVQGKLLKELGMFEPLKERIYEGVPVLATCAGMILLAEKIEGEDRAYFGTIPMTVKRNAYGRQLGSFYTLGDMKGVGKIPMTFIRAPYVSEISPEVEIFARVDGNIVAVKYKNQMALAFHPEVSDNTDMHSEFLKMVCRCSGRIVYN